MRLNVMTEPQEGVTYAQLLALAQHAERLGFEGFYRSDHYTSVSGHGERGSTDAWATLAGLARETQRIRLGTMVTPVTFRTAGNLAKVVATVTEMAGTDPSGRSRVDAGFGTGWLETEHIQHGFPFEDLATRFDRLAEHLAVVTGLWDARRAPFTFEGEHVTVRAARFVPPPDPRPRVVVGGRGMRKTPRLAAQFADELNAAFFTPEQCRQQRTALAEACEAIDRDPREVTYSVMTGCVVGATTAELNERVDQLTSFLALDEDVAAALERFRPSWIVGTPDEVADRLGSYAEAGVQRIMLQQLLVDDLDMLDVLSEHLSQD